MKRLTASFLLILFVCLSSAPPLRAGYVIEPTLLSALEPTLVTARTTGSTRFYSGTTPPNYRVRLTQRGEPLNLLQPSSVSPTRITFLVPRLAPGYYGFVIRAQDPGSGIWFDVYESAWRYFLVAEDTNPTRVFSTFELTTPSALTHTWEFLNTTQFTASGVISGNVNVAEHVTGGPNIPPLLKDFPYDGEGDAGIRFDLDFNLDGYVTFAYSIPFEITVEVPRTVYAGQSFQFTARSFRYTGTPTLLVLHTHDYSTDQELMINVPYDTLPALDIQLSQQPTYLTVSGSIPSGVPWVSLNLDPINIGGPFDDGSASFGGVTLQLGGQTTFGNSYAYSAGQPNDIMQFWTGTRRVENLWSAAGDQIVFLAAAPIPVVQPACIALSGAGVSLNHNWNVNIRSADFIQMKPPYLYDFQASPPLNSPSNWVLNKTFTMSIPGYLFSDFTYEMATSLGFDMEFINPITLASWPLADVAFARAAQWNWFTARFTINVPLEVLPRDDWLIQYAPHTTSDVALINYLPTTATAESNRIAALVITPPPGPTLLTITNLGTLPLKPEAEFALMLGTNPPAGGTVTVSPPPNDGGYAAGTTVTLLASPDPGYQFAGWTGDVTSPANPVKTTMSAVKQITPVFARLASLQTSVAAGRLTLSWPPDTEGYVLETTPSLTPPVTWTAIPTGTTNRFSAPIETSGHRFFRLRFGP